MINLYFIILSDLKSVRFTWYKLSELQIESLSFCSKEKKLYRDDCDKEMIMPRFSDRNVIL